MIFFSSEISSLLTPRIVKTRQMPSTTCAKMAMHRALCDYFGIAFAAVEGRMQNIQMLWIWQSLFDFRGTFSLGDIAVERLKTFRMNVVINAVPCAMFFQNFI